MKKSLPCILIFLAACYTVPELSGFDAETWKHSPACGSTHPQQAVVLVSQQEALLGLGQAQVKTLLGAPAEHELYDRNQKFFHYNLMPLTGCDTVRQKRLSIRFDALDRVKEVRITLK